MESSDQNKPQALKILRLSARIISILLIPFCVFGALVWAFMLNPKVGSNYAPLKDYLIVFSIGIYIIGLLIGFKWELWGALISLLWFVAVLIYLIYFNSGITIFYLSILLVPCILYMLSWYLHREFRINQQNKEENLNLTE